MRKRSNPSVQSTAPSTALQSVRIPRYSPPKWLLRLGESSSTRASNLCSSSTRFRSLMSSSKPPGCSPLRVARASALTLESKDSLSSNWRAQSATSSKVLLCMGLPVVGIRLWGTSLVSLLLLLIHGERESLSLLLAESSSSLGFVPTTRLSLNCLGALDLPMSLRALSATPRAFLAESNAGSSPVK
ncbi:hypothetical protein ES703_92125 [subsurface metagenome]